MKARSVLYLAVLLSITFLFTGTSYASTGNENPITFEDWNNDTNANVFEVFGNATWVIEDGHGGKVLNMTGDYAASRTLTTLGSYVLFPETYGDFAMEADIKFADAATATAAIIFGWQDDANYTYSFFHFKDSMTKLRSVVDGGRDDFVSGVPGSALTINEWHHVKVQRVGSTVTVWENGNQIMQAEDPQNLKGRIGFGTWQHSTAWDNVKVYIP